MVNKRYVSYDDMHVMLNEMFRKMAIDGYKPDLVVGITRGGLVPAVHVSHYFDVPMTTIQYSLRDHAILSEIDGKPVGPDLTLNGISNAMRAGKKILFVDDICDEGHTLFNIMTSVENMEAWIPGFDSTFAKTAVLQHNLGATLFSPDYCGEEINKVDNPVWIVYPFEY